MTFQLALAAAIPCVLVAQSACYWLGLRAGRSKGRRHGFGEGYIEGLKEGCRCPLSTGRARVEVDVVPRQHGPESTQRIPDSVVAAAHAQAAEALASGGHRAVTDEEATVVMASGITPPATRRRASTDVTTAPVYGPTLWAEVDKIIAEREREKGFK